MKLVKNSDITLTVENNGAPHFLRTSKVPAKCALGLRIFEVLLTDFFWATFSRVLQKLAQKKSVRSTLKVRRSLRLWPSMQSTFCWDLTGSKKMGRTVIFNSERYIAILDQFHGDLTQKLTQGHLRLAWFMQDGAKPYTAHASLKHLRFFFKNRLISLNTDHEWVPPSPYLNPLDF